MTIEEKRKYCASRGSRIDDSDDAVESLFAAHRSSHEREERGAWVAFAAADIAASIGSAVHTDLDGDVLAKYMSVVVGKVADAMLTAYRARFGAAPSEDA